MSERESLFSARRLRSCVEAWPECATGEYDPRCCRFPKSCSCTAYDPERVDEGELEPDRHPAEPRWTREDRIRANHQLLATLTALWDEYPDMRFGQLVMNLSRTEGGFADTWEWGHATWRERIEKVWTEWAEAHNV